MKKIILKEFCDFLYRYTINEDFVGVKVLDKVDMLGNEYVEPVQECNYVFLGDMTDKNEDGVNLFIAEHKLIKVLLRKYIKEIEDGSIYEHGYPEGRLIPSSHYEDCNEQYSATIKDEICELVDSVLSEYFK